MENDAAEIWLTIISAKRALLSCGGSRAGCKYVSCRAGDTPALQKRAAIAEVLFLVQSKRVVGEAPTTAREARALPGKTQSAISSLPLDRAGRFS